MTKKEQLDLLAALLKEAILVKQDRELVKKLLTKLKDSPWNTVSQQAAKALSTLLDQDLATKKKIEQRLQAKTVDILKDSLVGFSDLEISNIVKECHSLQLTDGCTVGCPWCCFFAQPFVKVKFSYSSLLNFLKKFGQYLPNNVTLYWSSDPFDWCDQDKSLVELTQELKKYQTQTSISTAVPLGTEFTIIRYIMMEYQKVLQNKKTKNENNSFFQKNNASILAETYDQLLNKKTISTKKILDYVLLQKKTGNNRYKKFRFSETNINTKRINHIFKLLQFLEIDDEFLDSLRIEQRNLSDGSNVINMGRYINNPKRDPLKDVVGTACYDGTLITPSSIESLSVIGVSKNSPEGLIKQTVRPGKQMLIQTYYVFDFMNKFYDEKFLENWQILPPIVSLQFEKGILKKKTELQLLARDLLTYGFLWLKIIPVIDVYSNMPGQSLYVQKIIQILKQQFQQRVKISKKLLPLEKDTEIKSTTQLVITKLEDWFANRKTT
jgi:hypothetical protein